MINCLRHPIRERFVPKAVLALDVVLWLLALPMALRIHGVPILLKRLAADAKQKKRTILELEGYPVGIHFGVRKDKNNLTGHSWVTMEGKPVADTTSSAIFKVVYSHPSSAREDRQI